MVVEGDVIREHKLAAASHVVQQVIPAGKPIVVGIDAIKDGELQLAVLFSVELPLQTCVQSRCQPSWPV